MCKGRNRLADISYHTQYNSITSAFDACGIQSRKKTHSGRGSGAREAEQVGADGDQLRRLGRWNTDSMNNNYLTHFPRVPIRLLNGFKPEHGRFWIKRGLIVPPASLQSKVFPGADRWLDLVTRGDGCEQTICGQGFLKLLIAMRTIILQDVVALRSLFPGLISTNPLFAHPLFSDPEFLAFEQELRAAMRTERAPEDLRIEEVMPDVSTKLAAIENKLTMLNAASECRQDRSQDQLLASIEHLFTTHVTDMFNMQYQLVPVSQGSGSVTFSPAAAAVSSSLAPPPPPQASSSSAIPSPTEKVPINTQVLNRSLQTVSNVWEEWTLGWCGKPAIKLYEANVKVNNWRSGAAGTKQ